MSHLVCILAAGRGSRMAPLTHHIPKPLLPFGGVPLLARSLLYAASTSPAAIYVNAHHRAAELRSFQERSLRTPSFELVIEDQLLGTAGGVRGMVAEASAQGIRFDSVLVINADILTTAPLANLLSALRSDEDTGAALLTLSAERAEGNIKVEAAGNSVRALSRVVELPGRGNTRFSASSGSERPLSTTGSVVDASFGGISALGRELIEGFPLDTAGCLVRDVLGPALASGGTLRAVTSTGFWSDLGTPGRWVNAVQMLHERPEWLSELPGQQLAEAHTPCFEERAALPHAIELRDPGAKRSVRFAPA